MSNRREPTWEDDVVPYAERQICAILAAGNWPHRVYLMEGAYRLLLDYMRRLYTSRLDGTHLIDHIGTHLGLYGIPLQSEVGLDGPVKVGWLPAGDWRAVGPREIESYVLSAIESGHGGSREVRLAAQAAVYAEDERTDDPTMLLHLRVPDTAALSD